jgi:hypothetical protein
MNTISIVKCTVLLRGGHMDEIFFDTDLPSNIIGGAPFVQFKTEQCKGTGVEWVRKNLHLEPDVIQGS